MPNPESIRFWRNRDITDRLIREREYRRTEIKPVCGFRIEENRNVD